MSLWILGIALLAWIPGAAFAGTTFLIQSNESSIVLSLDALGKSDTQSGPLAGSLSLNLDKTVVPPLGTLEDFSVSTVGVIHFKIDLGAFGGGKADLKKLEIVEFHPIETPDPVSPLLNGSLSFSNLSYTTFGDATYAVTGLACALVQSSGRPCNDSVDFDNGPPETIDVMQCQLSSVPGRQKLEVHYFFARPLDSTSPDLGTVSGTASVVAYSPPALEMSWVADKLQIRWPKAASTFQLYSTTRLSEDAAWTLVTPGPTESGDWKQVLVAPSEPAQFFQLR